MPGSALSDWPERAEERMALRPVGMEESPAEREKLETAIFSPTSSLAAPSGGQEEVEVLQPGHPEYERLIREPLRQGRRFAQILSGRPFQEFLHRARGEGRQVVLRFVPECRSDVADALEGGLEPLRVSEEVAARIGRIPVSWLSQLRDPDSSWELSQVRRGEDERWQEVLFLSLPGSGLAVGDEAPLQVEQLQVTPIGEMTFAHLGVALPVGEQPTEGRREKLAKLLTDLAVEGNVEVLCPMGIPREKRPFVGGLRRVGLVGPGLGNVILSEEEFKKLAEEGRRRAAEAEAAEEERRRQEAEIQRRRVEAERAGARARAVAAAEQAVAPLREAILDWLEAILDRRIRGPRGGPVVPLRAFLTPAAVSEMRRRIGLLSGEEYQLELERREEETGEPPTAPHGRLSELTLQLAPIVMAGVLDALHFEGAGGEGFDQAAELLHRVFPDVTIIPAEGMPEDQPFAARLRRLLSAEGQPGSRRRSPAAAGWTPATLAMYLDLLYRLLEEAGARLRPGVLDDVIGQIAFTAAPALQMPCYAAGLPGQEKRALFLNLLVLPPSALSVVAPPRKATWDILVGLCDLLLSAPGAFRLPPVAGGIGTRDEEYLELLDRMARGFEEGQHPWVVVPPFRGGEQYRALGTQARDAMIGGMVVPVGPWSGSLFDVVRAALALQLGAPPELLAGLLDDELDTIEGLLEYAFASHRKVLQDLQPGRVSLFDVKGGRLGRTPRLSEQAAERVGRSTVGVRHFLGILASMEAVLAGVPGSDEQIARIRGLARRSCDNQLAMLGAVRQHMQSSGVALFDRSTGR